MFQVALELEEEEKREGIIYIENARWNWRKEKQKYRA